MKLKKVKIRIVKELTIDNCSLCPEVTATRTQGAGLAFDYACPRLSDRKIMGYVEYSSDYNPVPDDCPLRVSDGEKDPIG